MACEFLLPVDLEVALAIVDHDGIVHRLTREVLAVGVHRGCWNRMHVWLTDVLGHYWDAKLPNVDLLVISRRDKAAAVLDEGDRINRPKMLLILLNGLL
jgi:hypothetical protein